MSGSKRNRTDEVKIRYDVERDKVVIEIEGLDGEIRMREYCYNKAVKQLKNMSAWGCKILHY